MHLIKLLRGIVNVALIGSIVGLLIHPRIDKQHYIVLKTVCLVFGTLKTIAFNVGLFIVFIERVSSKYIDVQLCCFLYHDSMHDADAGFNGMRHACCQIALGLVDGKVLYWRRCIVLA
eukprot:GHVR01089661.1.p1 GENE.GHVR01089661.1~~GHVR01089661.1.p1  ORF type:complete len:118 (-),score=4.10 GHVR01089661.1:1065-1418(-)